MKKLAIIGFLLLVSLLLAGCNDYTAIGYCEDTFYYEECYWERIGRRNWEYVCEEKEKPVSEVEAIFDHFGYEFNLESFENLCPIVAAPDKPLKVIGWMARLHKGDEECYMATQPDTIPSVDRQVLPQNCGWVTDPGVCVGKVFEDGSWQCDHKYPLRPVEELEEIFGRIYDPDYAPSQTFTEE